MQKLSLICQEREENSLFNFCDNRQESEENEYDLTNVIEILKINNENGNKINDIFPISFSQKALIS